MTAMSGKIGVSALLSGPRQVIRYVMHIRIDRRRRSRPARQCLAVAAVLALLAMVHVIGLGGWHAAIVGHVDQSMAAAHAHHHDDDEPSMPQIDLHQMTHSVIAGFADLAPGGSVALISVPTKTAWRVLSDRVRPGDLPTTLLRPPRG